MLQLQNVGIKSQGSIICLAGWQKIKQGASDPVLCAVVSPAQAAAPLLLFWSYKINAKAAVR